MFVGAGDAVSIGEGVFMIALGVALACVIVGGIMGVVVPPAMQADKPRTVMAKHKEKIFLPILLQTHLLVSK